MPDESPLPPTADAPKARPAAAATRVPVKPSPAAPGPQAGHPIQSVRRALPPGIPPHLAGAIVTEGGAPAAAVPAAPALHPSFAPLPQERVQLRRQAEALRSQLGRAAKVAQETLAAIDTTLDLAAKNSDAPALLEAEALDLDRIKAFRTAISTALDLTK